MFENKRKMRILKQSHSAEKLKRGDPLGLLKLQFVAKHRKIGRETLWRQKIEKSRRVPKKVKVVTLYSRLVLYLTLKM